MVWGELLGRQGGESEDKMRAVWKKPGKVPGVCLILCKLGFWRAVEDCIEIRCRKGSNCLLRPTGGSETEPRHKVT